MIKLFVFISIFFLTGAAALAADKDGRWQKEYSKPEIIIPVAISAASLLTWVARDYVEKNQEVARRRFKDELIHSLENTIQEAIKEREGLLTLKLQPLHYSINKLAEDLREGKLTDKEVEKNIHEIKIMLGEFQARLSIVEATMEGVVERLNKELSTVLSAYLSVPVNVKTSMKEKSHDKDLVQ